MMGKQNTLEMGIFCVICILDPYLILLGILENFPPNSPQICPNRKNDC